jgi:predicted transcriptional regulator
MKNLPPLSEIKRLRKKLNISQKNLALNLNLTQSTISRIESGAIDPPYTKFKVIFEYLEEEKSKRKKSKRYAKDVMTKDIKLIKPDSSIRDAVELMNEYSISQLPIIENKYNYGSVTSKKIQKCITDNPKIINADVALIKELPFPEIDKEWNVKDISDLLLQYPAVLVRKNNDYIGIITDSDLLRINNTK